jgi:hypothetical protein
MLVLLSSGARARYLDDVLRALALPEGAELQFRYDEAWISENVKVLLEDKIEGKKAVVCFSDQSSETDNPIIVPCRLVTLVRARRTGSTFVITFKVDGFPGEGVTSPNQQIQSAPDTPKYASGKLVGKWFYDIPNWQISEASFASLQHWEDVVKSLANRPDFAREKRDFFLSVRGIFDATNEDKAVVNRGAFDLAPDTYYFLDCYHFHPSVNAESVKSLILASLGEAVEIFSVSKLLVDSRYDAKQWRFKTIGGFNKSHGGLEVRASKETSGKDETPFLDLPISVRADRTAIFIKLALVTFGVGLSSLTVLSATGKLTITTGGVAILGAVLAAAGTIWKSK